MSDTPRTDAGCFDSFEHPLTEQNCECVTADFARTLERELTAAKGEIERMREAALGVLDAMEVVRIAKQSEGAGGGSWISRPATREHQARMQKAYADMHKAEAALCNALKEPK
jgi:hypothetical protein